MTGPTQPSSSRPRYTNEEIAFILHHHGPTRTLEEVARLYNLHFNQSRSKEGLSSLIHKVRDPRRPRKDDHDEGYYLTLATTFDWYPDIILQTLETGSDTFTTDAPATNKSKAPQEGNDALWTNPSYHHSWTDEQRAFALLYHRRIPRFEDLLAKFNTHFGVYLNSSRLKSCLTYIQNNDERVQRLLDLGTQFAWYEPLPSPSDPQRAKMERVERKRVVGLEYRRRGRERREAWKRGDGGEAGWESLEASSTLQNYHTIQSSSEDGDEGLRTSTRNSSQMQTYSRPPSPTSPRISIKPEPDPFSPRPSPSSITHSLVSSSSPLLTLSRRPPPAPTVSTFTEARQATDPPAPSTPVLPSGSSRGELITPRMPRVATFAETEVVLRAKGRGGRRES